MATLLDERKAVQAQDDWADDAAGIDQGSVEQMAESYPYVQWVNGDPKAKKAGDVTYTGGWFLPAEGLNVDELPGWTKDTLVHDDGTETDGWFKRDITVAMLQLRQGWFVKVDKREQRFPYDQFDEAKAFAAAREKRPYSRVHVLCVIRGLEGIGPVFLTLRGSVKKQFTMRKGGVLGEFDRKVIQVANAATRKRGVTVLVNGKSQSPKWAWRAFWLTVGPKRNEKGEPIFDTVGEGDNSSQVTLPMALGLKDKPTEADAQALYVGKAARDLFNELWKDTVDWAHAWDQAQAAEPEKDAAAGTGYAYADGETSADEPDEETRF